MRKSILVVVAVMALSSCTTIGKLAGKAADVNDSALDSAEFTICNGASVGSILRRYDTVEKAKVWQSLCLPTVRDVLTPDDG